MHACDLENCLFLFVCSGKVCVFLDIQNINNKPTLSSLIFGSDVKKKNFSTRDDRYIKAGFTSQQSNRSKYQNVICAKQSSKLLR